MTSLIDRHLLVVGREALDAFPVLMVSGARQVGKSTFAQMLTAGRPHRQLNLDDDETLRTATADPRGFVSQAPGSTLVIDEIQRAPRLLLAIKAAVDRERVPGRFVLTGSSNLLALTSTPDSLAGRAVTLNLHGLSQGEIAGRKEDVVTWFRDAPSPEAFATRWQRHDYVAALARGGYPELGPLSARNRELWLDSYIERILTRDIADLSSRLATNRATEVLRMLAANQGGELVKSRIARQLGAPVSAVETYLRALTTLYLVQEVRPWTANLTTREVGRRKIAVTDSALAMHLAGVRAQTLDSLRASEHLGSLLEAFAVTELAKQRTWSDERFTLYHYRDRNGLEVDIVVEYADGQVFLLEVKASQSYHPAHTKGIRALAARLGPRFLGGAVLGLTDHGYLLGDRIYGLPLSVLWEAG